MIHRQKQIFSSSSKETLLDANAAIEQLDGNLSSVNRVKRICCIASRRREEKEGGSRAAYVTDCTWRDPTLLFLSATILHRRSLHFLES